MSKLPESLRQIAGIIIGTSLGLGIVITGAVVLFHKPVSWEMVWMGTFSGVFGGLLSLARTHPRLQRAIRAGIWATLAAGVTWIVTALIETTFIRPLFGLEVFIPPLIVLIIAGIGLYRWFEEQEPLEPQRGQ
jgi:hypothetical protein